VLQLVVFAVVRFFVGWTGKYGFRGEEFGLRVWRRAELLVLIVPSASACGWCSWRSDMQFGKREMSSVARCTTRRIDDYEVIFISRRRTST
jgi:hypothetical protein